MTTLITSINQAATVLAANDIQLITFEHDIRYDTDLSQMYYDEFISNASGCHDVQKFESYLVIYGNDVSRHDKHFSQCDIKSLSDYELLVLYNSLGLCTYDLGDKDDLIHELITLDNEDYYTKYYNETYYRDLDYTFSFSGYSQGDSYKVQTVGNVEPWLNADYLTNIFYDCPISGTIDIYINGDLIDELYVDSMLEDNYNWDKVQLINNVSNATLDKNYHTLLNQYLLDNLPNDLEYN